MATIGPAVSANVTFDVADNPDYGDDVIIDNDKGVNGYTVQLETNDISAEARAAALGWEAVMSTDTNPVVLYYKVTGGEAPEGGLSFIRVKMLRGETTYEAFFFHAMQFTGGQESASTKQKQITWNHPTMTGTGIGCYLDSSGEIRYFDYMEFDTQAAAESWINTKAGYTPPSNG